MVILCCLVMPHPEKINLSVTTGCKFLEGCWILESKMKLVEVLLQPVTPLHDHVRYVLLSSKSWMFFRLPGRLFEWLLRRCSFSWNVLLLHWTLYLCGGKRSGAEVCCKLQESEQSTSSVQVLKGQFAKLPNSNLLGCRSVRIKHKQCVQLMCYLSQNRCNLD